MPEVHICVHLWRFTTSADEYSNSADGSSNSADGYNSEEDDESDQYALTSGLDELSLCVIDGHVQVATISCSGLKDPDTVEEKYEATSDERKNSFVDCGDSSAIQSMNLADAGDGITTRVTFGCLKISLPEFQN
ncbi:hypothetical protein AVEN_32291-1 [Araneus ventricosus]|uniref:Uncharacterized protein n=1 Tax=Araneus ventricosus TaxID=182803 RepID=A0A4Y2XDS4_ARAVE|nr:hypothetical protein AVEN_32291-1 [Araneus ventricosus]